VIVDSSVWIDFARDRATPHVDVLIDAIRQRAAMTTDVVRLEVLSRIVRFEQIAAALDSCEDVRQLPRSDVEQAAIIYRTCRRAGETIRSLNDCVLSAIAIRTELPVLHNDRDFEVIARHTDLRVVET
jgi:predicted nucleic acid-binding protein